MPETGRRTAISTSELGLYADRTDRYSGNRYSPVVRKFVIGVMVVVAAILVAIFLYDFTSATSTAGKVSQETKHIYILQNALKKASNSTKKAANPIFQDGAANRTDLSRMQDRSDIESFGKYLQREKSEDLTPIESRVRDVNNPEIRSQNLNNFMLRKRVLKTSAESKLHDEDPEGKQLFDNHAVVYRVKQRYKEPILDEESSSEESKPTPFHWEFRTPHPTSFKRPKYPQLSQYRYPHSSRNIQDIIKYLTNDAEVPNRGIKFTGVYVNPKKYDMYPEIGEMMSNSDRSEEEEGSAYPAPFGGDPFYQYKPKHPADVNLLANSNVRFSPTGTHRFNPYYDPFYARPTANYKFPSTMDNQYDNLGGFSPNNYQKKRKPKPFSVMLDIYPITDIGEQNKKTTRPRPQLEDYEARRPLQFNRGPKFYAPLPHPVPIVALPSQQTALDEDERQQMIFHLNLYPRKKNKMNRHDIIHRSESMAPEERQRFMEKIMSPLETITKHLAAHSAIEDTRTEQNEETSSNHLSLTRYHETSLDGEGEKTSSQQDLDRDDHPDVDQDDDPKIDATLPSNHKATLEDDYASTEKYEFEAQRIVETTTGKECATCNATLVLEEAKISGNKSVDLTKDVDTIEGFQRFSDGLSGSE
ncbi:hypothetical protein KM043_014811 [Ampulex compressa]|nr:hypothetical protein KM043_014811 [Ampulex compressa]